MKNVLTVTFKKLGKNLKKHFVVGSSSISILTHPTSYNSDFQSFFFFVFSKISS